MKSTNEVVWHSAPRPAKAILLRTKEPVEFQYAGDALRIKLPDGMRSKSVDVVKLELVP